MALQLTKSTRLLKNRLRHAEKTEKNQLVMAVTIGISHNSLNKYLKGGIPKYGNTVIKINDYLNSKGL